MKQKLLPAQRYKVSEPFRKAIQKSPFKVLIPQRRIRSLKEKGSLPLLCSFLRSERSAGAVPQAGRCSKEFCQPRHTAHSTHHLHRSLKRWNSRSRLCFLADSGIQREPRC